MGFREDAVGAVIGRAAPSATVAVRGAQGRSIGSRRSAPVIQRRDPVVDSLRMRDMISSTARTMDEKLFQLAEGKHPMAGVLDSFATTLSKFVDRPVLRALFGQVSTSFWGIGTGLFGAALGANQSGLLWSLFLTATVGTAVASLASHGTNVRQQPSADRALAQLHALLDLVAGIVFESNGTYRISVLLPFEGRCLRAFARDGRHRNSLAQSARPDIADTKGAGVGAAGKAWHSGGLHEYSSPVAFASDAEMYCRRMEVTEDFAKKCQRPSRYYLAYALKRNHKTVGVLVVDALERSSLVDGGTTHDNLAKKLQPEHRSKSLRLQLVGDLIAQVYLPEIYESLGGRIDA